MYEKGWPEPYIYTVYDRTSDDIPAKITVYTILNGSGQPYLLVKGKQLVNMLKVMNLFKNYGGFKSTLLMQEPPPL
jgi:hypothetical protein